MNKSLGMLAATLIGAALLLVMSGCATVHAGAGEMARKSPPDSATGVTPDDAVKMEKFVVTGSHVRADEKPAAPAHPTRAPMNEPVAYERALASVPTHDDDSFATHAGRPPTAAADPGRGGTSATGSRPASLWPAAAGPEHSAAYAYSPSIPLSTAAAGGPKPMSTLREPAAEPVEVTAFVLPPPPSAAADLKSKPSTNLSGNIIDGREFRQVRVYYGTERLPESDGKFGAARNLTATPISYGSIFVSIPREHKPGMVDRPSLWNLEFRENPIDFMMILNRIPKSREEFLADIRATLQRNGSDSSFIFVHGFNVSFDEAALRTAQITYDLNYNGAPVFYSWPSVGAVEDYDTDYDNSEWARANLKKFLLDYVQESGAQNIYLIAHSMGNRALGYALIDLFSEHPEMKGRFKEIILAAPDVDADIFRRDIAPALTSTGEKVTLYVSAGDKALLASRKIRSNYVRIGDASRGIKVLAGIETVDATGLDTSFLQHSYFAENTLVREDIRKLVFEHLRAAQRGLQELLTDGGQTYWKFLSKPPRP